MLNSMAFHSQKVSRLDETSYVYLCIRPPRNSVAPHMHAHVHSISQLSTQHQLSARSHVELYSTMQDYNIKLTGLEQPQDVGKKGHMSSDN